VGTRRSAQADDYEVSTTVPVTIKSNELIRGNPAGQLFFEFDASARSADL